MRLDPEVKRLRALSPAELADEAGAAKAKTEAIKTEAIRRGLHRAEGQLWKLALSPPGESNRTERERLLSVLGITETEFVSRFTTLTHTDWVMRCTARKIPQVAEVVPTKARKVA